MFVSFEWLANDGMNEKSELQPMTANNSRSAEKILSEEFLVARAKILEVAAVLDRIERGTGDVEAHPQMRLLEEGIRILNDLEPKKAERVQLLMSKPFDPDWRTRLDVDSGRRPIA